MCEDAVVERAAQVGRAHRCIVGHQAGGVFQLGRLRVHRAVARGRGALQQGLDQRGQRDVLVQVVAHARLAVRGDERAAEVHALRAHAEVVVRQDRAQHHGQVGVVEQRAGLGRAGHTQVGAVQLHAGVHAVVGQQAAPHEGGEHGQLQAARQFGHARLDAEAAHFHVHHQHRALGGLDARHPFVGALGHGLRAVGAGRQHGHLGHGVQRHVARHLDQHGLRQLHAVAQHAGNVLGRRLGVGQAHLVAGDLAEDAPLRIDVAHLVVQHQARVRLDLAGAAGQDDQRRALGIGAGHGVDDVERARAVGDRHHAQAAVHARGGVGGKAQRGLVAQRHQGEDVAFLDLLEQRQDEVAGNAKNFLRAVVLEGAQQREAEGHGNVSGGFCKARMIVAARGLQH